MEAYRDTYVEINLSYLKDNVLNIYRKCQKPIMAIVKADAYGHGASQVAKAVSDFDFVKMFGVATLGEALALRQAGVQRDILVLGAVRDEDLFLAAKLDISICVFSLAYLEKLKMHEFSLPLKIHLKIDSGMNRLGLRSAMELESALTMIAACPQLKVMGIFTHYGAADEENDSYARQFSYFREIIKDRYFPYIHAANTAAALYHQEDFTNLVRIGIGMYGLEPNGSDDTPLKQVMSLWTRVVMVKKIKKGESIGYGFTYTASSDEYIATVPIGYADGMIRKNQGREVYIHGKYYPIVGRICMDQMMIRVDEQIQVSDQVEIFGPHISLNRMAKELDTISYEIICLLSMRVERRYIEA